MATAELVQHARRRAPSRRPISFQRLIKRISEQYGVQAATAWTKAVLGYQAQISDAALRAAIASGNVDAIAAVVGVTRLQQTVTKALVGPFTAASQTVGGESARVLSGHSIDAVFNAAHPNVILFAREQAAQLVVDIPRQTTQIIAEVIARGAERGLTVVEQARAIREVVGLPPNWALAPQSLADELSQGRIASATGRRLSAATKQKIRSAARRGTLTPSVIADFATEYAASLVNRRALNIARTETLRASNFGLTESWRQAQQQGVLPATARRFWIVTPDDRLSMEHARIPGMNKAGRRLNEAFFTPEGIFMHPPTRPNCRCTVGLGFPRKKKVPSGQ